MNRRERDKLFNKVARDIGVNIIDIVRHHRDDLRLADAATARAPNIDYYGDAKGGGIFLTQGDDEISLTHAQAKRLRNLLNTLYPRKGKR